MINIYEDPKDFLDSEYGDMIKDIVDSLVQLVKGEALSENGNNISIMEDLDKRNFMCVFFGLNPKDSDKDVSNYSYHKVSDYFFYVEFYCFTLNNLPEEYKLSDISDDEIQLLIQTIAISDTKEELIGSDYVLDKYNELKNELSFKHVKPS